MGRTHKPVFEAAGHEVIISGRNSTPSLEVAASMADLTIITVPISATQQIIERVAPVSEAVMDFTGVKIPFLDLMKHYAPKNAEVGSLHPLYGERESIYNETVVYCPTEKSGEKCKAVIGAFEKAGAKVLIKTAEEHDRLMHYTQNERTFMLRRYISGLMHAGLSLEEVYAVSPPPTRILLDLLARQVDIKNGSMYEEMLSYNRFSKLKYSQEERAQLKTPEEIRTFFGRELVAAQKRADRFIKESKCSIY